MFAGGLLLLWVAYSMWQEMRPGATEHFNKPGYRLRAAVVETPRGAYYIKMTGPAKTMAAAEADWKKFLSTLRFSAGSAYPSYDSYPP